MAKPRARRTTEVCQPKDWLSSLPLELIELIAEDLPANDLLRFRQTCRMLYAG